MQFAGELSSEFDDRTKPRRVKKTTGKTNFEISIPIEECTMELKNMSSDRNMRKKHFPNESIRLEYDTGDQEFTENKEASQDNKNSVSALNEIPFDHSISANGRCSDKRLCLCEVTLHSKVESCWLIAHGNVYDVTKVLADHPGGVKSILRHADGRDCAEDMGFHSKSAQSMWKECKIGKLAKCQGEENKDNNPSFCTIM